MTGYFELEFPVSRPPSELRTIAGEKLRKTGILTENEYKSSMSIKENENCFYQKEMFVCLLCFVFMASPEQ